MQFPIYLRIGSLQIHPHWVFETLAYAVAFRIYLTLRRRKGDALDDDARWWVIAAAAAGAAMGSKVLYWFEDPRLTLAHWHDPIFMMGGKTIVGALVGSLVAVEWTKLWLGIKQCTGDLFALPTVAGIAIGRIGCFLTGLEDQTAGTRTSMPWGVNFGDGPRHPTQLYEIFFLILLGLTIARLTRRPHREGDLFKTLMIAYFAFRLTVDFLRPDVKVLAGLSSIQCVCAAMLIYYSPDILYWLAVRARTRSESDSTQAVTLSAESRS